MAVPINQRIVSSKLDILVEQKNLLEEKRNHLQTLVDESNEVLHLGTTWLKNADGGKNLTFSEICTLLEDKIMFLSNTDCFVYEKAIDKESSTLKYLPQSTTYTDQPLSTRNDDVPDITSDLKTIMNQVRVIQDAMSFLSTSTEKISEKQLNMENTVESLFLKYAKIEDEKIRQIEAELKDISEKHKTATFQIDKKMKYLESKIQTVTDTQSDIVQDINQNNIQHVKIKDQMKASKRLQKQSQQFMQDQSGVLENIQELADRICHLENQSSMDTKLEHIDNKMKVFETNFERLQNFEDQIKSLDLNWSEFSLEAEKNSEEIQTKYNMVCQIVADRLAPLERLRDVFNKKLDVMKENKTKLDSVCDQMADLLPKISQLETEKQGLVVGFSATVDCITKLYEEMKVTNYSDVTSNIGNSFNPISGEFTIPLDGLYAIHLYNHNTFDFTYIIMKYFKISNFSTPKDVPVIFLRGDHNHSSIFTVVQMKKGETLFLKCKAPCKAPSDEDSHEFIPLGDTITLTCWKIY